MNGAGMWLSQPPPAVEATQTNASLRDLTHSGNARRWALSLHRASGLLAAGGDTQHALGIVHDLLGNRPHLDKAHGVLRLSHATDPPLFVEAGPQLQVSELPLGVEVGQGEHRFTWVIHHDRRPAG